MKRVQYRPFTLIEVIVSMAIFSLLMLGLMQFFTSAQGIWTAASNRSQTYEEARAAMNMLATDLMCAYYEEGQSGTPEDHRYFFSVQEPSASYTAAPIFTTTPVYKFKGLAFATIRAVRGDEEATTRLTEVFYRKRGNILETRTISDVVIRNNANHPWAVNRKDEKFTVSEITTVNKTKSDAFPFAFLTGTSSVDPSNSNADPDIAATDWTALVSNVVRFYVKIYRPHGGLMQYSDMFSDSGNVTKFPDMVLIRLMTIDQQTATIIKNIFKSMDGNQNKDVIFENYLKTGLDSEGYETDDVTDDDSDENTNKIRELLRKKMVVFTRAVTIDREL